MMMFRKFTFLAPLFLICIISINVSTQTNVKVATRFDEFTYIPNTDEEHLTRFIREMEKHPTADGYAIIYGARVHEPYQNEADIIKTYVLGDLVWNIDSSMKSSIREKRFVAINGGLREKPMVELFIVPRGAVAPVPTPAYKPDQEVRCPSKPDVYAQRFVWRSDEQMTFTAYLFQWHSTENHEIKWSVSSGTIVAGQGTRTIKVRGANAEYQKITATVEVTGYSSECTTTATAESPAKLSTFPLLVARLIGDCEVDLAALEDFAGWLHNKPELRGYMIVYNGPIRHLSGMRQGESEAMAHYKLRYLIGFQGISKNKLTLIDGGFREKWSMELWLVDGKGELPAASPTIQQKDVKLEKGPIRGLVRNPCEWIG